MLNNKRKYFTGALKLSFTLIALYWVFSKVDLDYVVKIIMHANSVYLLLALLFFNLSKILSSVRLNIYFKHINVNIPEVQALKLYYIGMFYNLFLPGGIGGDGYKIYLLKKSHDVKTGKLIQATFLDRVSGLIPLLFMTGVLFFFSDFYGKIAWLDLLAIIGTIVVLPLFYLLNLMAFNYYMPIFMKTTMLGAVVQFLQLLSALCIVYAIDHQGQLIIFLTLFLCSSVVAVLPISIGGVGVRELTFVYGLTLLGMEASGGVAFSLLFFLITAFSSLAGIVLNEKKVTGTS